ncbi:MAG: thioesterase family protein [Humidesulfovibrio sp.]|uniref:acyl-CoA thioesterase n=1 Tax=Humidesulfovibrio sp. TaxID=2910988 RepID=UPI0027E84A9A|nr:thioesterase family protein [Humidesulfovibrio sp.]MDQ7836411.1 thioesterase family protein [Humidesulfovibrio sp.]
MPRIFTREHTVVESDIDIQGHVNNLRYLKWMQDVAVAHSTAQGWSMQRYAAEGMGWVVRSHTITYKRPAFLGEVLTTCTWIAGFSPRMSPRKYLFWRAADRCVLAEAETMWVFVDLKTGRPTKVPDELRAAFEIVEDEGEAKRMLEG